jgi:hypothetical protein
MSDDDVSLEDIIERLTHLNASAKRQTDTAYYARAHARPLRVRPRDGERMSSTDELVALLVKHGDVSYDLTTPRKYTQHGGWNEYCGCGSWLGDGDNPVSLHERHARHVADCIVMATSGASA